MYPNHCIPYETINTVNQRVGWYDSGIYAILQSLRSHGNSRMHDFFTFVSHMEAAFENVRQGMDYENQHATHHNGDDRRAVGWAGTGMMPIAIYLYYLKSWGIRGKVLECGVFKGGSTCCLSHVCDYLGLELIAADSYEGLPDGDTFYGQGDFRGGLEEVRKNLKQFGKPEVVTYVKGWFADSLRDFNKPVMLIWLDVDLRKSVVDVLCNTFHCLVDDGVIFCDGLGETRDFLGDQLVPASSESTGLLDYFLENKIDYKAIYSGFGHMGLVIPNPVNAAIIYSPHMIRSILLGSKPLRDRLHYIFRGGGRIPRG